MKQHRRKASGDGGPHIVAIGGGTGLSTMLRGLKHYSRNITAIVTMADDGGSSGLLRKDLGMPPPGDLRNCLQALANVEPIMSELLSYRFQDGSLAGQSFGNLFLAALDGISPSFEEAVERMNQILAVTGRVLPVTDKNVEIIAELENGTSVRGESKIFAFKKEQHCRIRRLRMEPERPPALPKALEAIADADVIILGPGSLYTSIIPNFLVDGISEAVAASKAKKLLIMNIMTQEGETEEYTLSEHIQALYDHGVPNMIDVCLANSDAVPEEIQQRYRFENAEPMEVDGRAVRKLGMDLICEPMAGDWSTLKARHDPEKLAQAIMNTVQARCVRTWTSTGIRYVKEH